MNRKIREWYDLTKCPTVALTWLNGNIHYSGPEELKGFANNPAVKKAFVASVFGLHSVGPNNNKSGNEKDKPENFQESIIEVPHDWEQLNAHGKRKLVIALVTNNGRKKPHWGDDDHKPNWWPNSLPFADPSNGPSRPNVRTLSRIIRSYRATSSDSDSDSDDYQSLSNANSDPDTTDLDPPIVSDNSPTASKFATEAGDDILTTFASLVELLPESIHSKNTAISIVRDVCSAKDWSMLHRLSKLLTEEFALEIDWAHSVIDARLSDIEIRCQVPDNMLRSGFEPIKVVGDGNCLFRSLCMVVYGSDKEHQWLKLWCIVFGCLQENHYVKQVNDKKNINTSY